MNKNQLVRLSEAAKICGVPSSTIRHYINFRLIETASKTKGGYYLLDELDLEMVMEIKRLQSEEGKELKEIKEMMKV